MGLVVFNTLGNRKEEFVPQNEGEVKMYVCGITAYDLCHLGHARANIVFDFIYRYLLFLGYHVSYVRNFTDIDDKIIDRALEEGVDFTVISERYIEAFKDDMERLGLLLPSNEPRATEHIPEIIALVEKLIGDGYAYEVDGDVYCSVDRIVDYGKLSGKKSRNSWQAHGSTSTRGRGIRSILPSGKGAKKGNLPGKAPGDPEGRVGTSNVPPCR